ncbi:MAG: hypothetical protein DI527_16460 [Chelatococcus sp.]|nr:MAG: hypothetical protein DI527_16460 [Chelatococcus sp.]
MSANSPFKRGIVRELRAEKAQARVEIEDEDGVSSFWLSVNSALASGNGSRVYAMPELGSQVHCLVDWRGEDGCILGASYSDKDPPPATDANHIAMKLGGGLELAYDKAAGTLDLATTAPLTIRCNGTSIRLDGDGATVVGGKIVLDGPVEMPKGFTAGTGAAGSQPATIRGKLHAEQDITSATRIAAPVVDEGGA